MEPEYPNLSEVEITRRLASLKDSKINILEIKNPYPMDLLFGNPKPAAVLMPLLQKPDGWHLLFIRRNTAMAEHSGQVAFPGGRSDDGDSSLEQTALREAYEEIGLNPKDVRILGKLGEFRTITNYLVTPIIAVIPWPYSLLAAQEEVSRIFTIPLSWLADPDNHESTLRELPKPYPPVPVIYFKEYEGETLWGASARFVQAFLEIMLLCNQ